jgi:hypothetical protein
MQTTFIEENLTPQQITNLCLLIHSNQCKSLEFRRCTISDLYGISFLFFFSNRILFILFN